MSDNDSLFLLVVFIIGFITLLLLAVQVIFDVI
jgi:hypothetical protein